MTPAKAIKEVERGPLSNRPPRRHKPSRGLQAALLHQQKNRCAYCGWEFGTIRQGRVVDLQWDHVIPFVFNGKNEMFVASCGACNRRKSSKLYCEIETVKKRDCRKARTQLPEPPIGKTQLDRHLAGIPIPRLEAVKAKCFECMGGYVEGLNDCEVPKCPLYWFMPYRRQKPILC